MQSYSDINKLLLKSWIPTYLVLMLHGSTLTQIGEFLLNFVIAPLVIGSSLACYEIKYNSIGRKSREMLHIFGIPKNEYIAFICLMALYIAIPIGVIFFSMIHAYKFQSYDGLNWLIYSFGGIMMKEVFEEIYNSRHKGGGGDDDAGDGRNEA